MTRNLVLNDPSENCWGLVCHVGSIGDDVARVIAFYKTKEEAEEAGESLRKKFDGRAGVKVFEYSYVKDEKDLMGLLALDYMDLLVKYLIG